MKALQRLSELDFEAKRKARPAMPEYAIPRVRFSDRTANGLTKCVLAWLRLHGHKAWRQGSEGRYRPGVTITDVVGRQRTLKGNWLPGQNNGASDVACIINGRFVAIEVKKQDRQSEAQQRYQEEVEASGGIYVIVRTFTEFYEFYQQLIQNHEHQQSNSYR
jgi:hypothetical protein